MSLFGDITIQRNFYQGGKRGGINQDFNKANAPFEQTASPDRTTLRSRARWLHENNGIVAGIDHSIKANTVGNGFKFQSKTASNALNKEIETKFNLWQKQANCDVTKRQHFGDMQSTILGQRMTDGEILIVKKLTGDKTNPFKLQLIESDRFDSGVLTVAKDLNYIDGIELDGFGAPLHYHFSDGLFKQTRLKASEVIHYYKMSNRATQYRGISEYKQIIIDLRNFAGFQASTIASARARANIAYAIESENAGGIPGVLAKDDNGDPIEAINGLMVHYLKKGEKIHQMDPTLNGTEYGEFVKAAIRMIAVGRQISYELAFRDYSQTNFSSARASLIQDHKRFSNEQWHLATYVLNPIFEGWLDANVLAGNIKGLSAQQYFKNKQKLTQPRWIAPVREWVDPLKDIKALKEELDLGLTTRTEAAAARGKELSEVLEARIEENKLLEVAGILPQEDKNA